jgi:hypothetical protein
LNATRHKGGYDQPGERGQRRYRGSPSVGQHTGDLIETGLALCP